MSNTFSQLYLHVVLAVQNHGPLIHPEWKDELYDIITDYLGKRGHTLVSINGMADHIHVLLNLNPSQSVSDMIKLLKQESSEWINTFHPSTQKFQWHEGYVVFSCSKDHVKHEMAYIAKQETHHKRISFREEYKALLNKQEIQFQEPLFTNS